MNHKKNCQYKFRKKDFKFHQYWIIYFTECHPDKPEIDYVTFIKAKSYQIAKVILKSKSKEENPKIKLKSIQGFMLHKTYKNYRHTQGLSIQDWENIRSSSFPNISNFLFKKEIPRPEGYTNRFNKTDTEQLKTIGFKKGKENWSHKHRKGQHLPKDQRKGKKWDGGKWVDWSKSEIDHTKNQIISALMATKNNKKASAKLLGICRNKLYSLMSRCEHPDWWNKNYPSPKRIPPKATKEERSLAQKKVMAKRKLDGKVIFQMNESQKLKRLENLKISHKNRSESTRKSLILKIKNALSHNSNSRAEAARSIGVKPNTFRAWMCKTKDLVDWSKEYPTLK